MEKQQQNRDESFTKLFTFPLNNSFFDDGPDGSINNDDSCLLASSPNEKQKPTEVDFDINLSQISHENVRSEMIAGSSSNADSDSDLLVSLVDSYDEVALKGFCTTRYDSALNFEYISYKGFERILEIASKYGGSRDKAVCTMLANVGINKEPSKISNLCRSYERFLKKIELKKLDGKTEMRKEFIKNDVKFPDLKMFDTEKLERGHIILSDQCVITNKVFLSLCRAKTSVKIRWEDISQFLSSYFEMSEEISPWATEKLFKDVQNTAEKLRRKKANAERNEFLSTPLSLKKTQIRPDESGLTTQQNDSEVEMHYQTEVESLHEQLDHLNGCYTEIMNESEAQNELHQKKVNQLKCEIEKLKSRNSLLKTKIMEKDDELVKFNARNYGKRERRKQEKIDELTKINNELMDKVTALERHNATIAHNYDCQRKRVFYYKKQLENSGRKSSIDTDKLKENVRFYENLSCQLQEKIHELDENCIQTFKNGKYSDEVRFVFYELLKRNISVENCSSIIRLILKKLANKDIDKLPKKSLTAELMVEAEIVSKLQVREALLESDNNCLNIDGTKYNFNEIGGYQVTTDKGSFTLGLEDMFSGDASSYMTTLKQMLEDMSSLVAVEAYIDDDVKKILYNFKSLMTDRCVTNSAFFRQFESWRKEVIPFMVENYNMLPVKEQENISRMHHVFCGLHVLHNLGIYAEKSLKEWESIVEEVSDNHGGFKNNTQSRTYSLFFELSKLTSYTHGDQRNGKADEWKAFLEKKGEENSMVSFLHHRFNIFFVLGGAIYYHRNHLSEFVGLLDSDNFLHVSIKKDIDYPVYLAPARALGIFNKLVSGPLFRIVEESGHIFALNKMWEKLLEYLCSARTDASEMMQGFTVFEEKYLSKDKIYVELFEETENPEFDSFTQECLEIICCTCSLMVQSQLKDQLPGGLYHQPSEDVIDETRNCLRTNVISERDFAQYDRKLSMKPTLSTIAACGVIMFSNNKTGKWLETKTTEELEKIICIARTNRYNWIKKYRQRRREILQFKMDQMDRKKLESEIKYQKSVDEKEYLTQKISDVGYINSVAKLDGICSSYPQHKLLSVLQWQVSYRKVVLEQKVADKRLMQMGGTVNGKYQKYDVDTLRSNLKQLIDYFSMDAEIRAKQVHCNKIRSETERKQLLAEKKEELLEDSNKSGNKGDKRKKNKVPTFFGKTILHKMLDNGKEIWYRGVVTAVLDDDEYDEECDFTVEYEGFDDTYDVKVVQEWRLNCIVIEKAFTKKQKI